LSLLTHKYKLISIEDGEDIQTMFQRFQTILNELHSLGRHYDNYDHIDKILRSLSRKWKPQVTTLITIQNLDSMTLEELIKILKVHQQELAQGERTKKWKSLALRVQRPKHNFASKESSSKALIINDASGEESKDDDFDEEDDELSLITGALLDEKVSCGPKILLKDFQDLAEKMKSSTTTLENSEKENKEMLKQKLLLQKECMLANNELD